MKSTSETGHAKNVANFKSLISFCKGYGSKYNPSKETIKAANLDIMLANAETGLTELKLSETAFNNAGNNRLLGFKTLKSLATQIINALDATDASAETVKDARRINRKIQGKRAKEKAELPPADNNAPLPPDKTISVSQLSYDSLIDHFEKLVTTVTADASYKPNEKELDAKGITDKLEELRMLNTAVINKFTTVSNSRIKRNENLYNPLTGLVQTAQDVKKYVCSVFKANSEEYKQINRIQFKTRK